MRRSRHLRAAVAILPIASFAACAPTDGEGGRGAVSVRLHLAPGEATKCAGLRTGIVTPEGQLPCGVTHFRLCAAPPLAEGAPRCSGLLEFPIEAALTGVRFEVPAGADRVITFQGYDSERDERAVWCGKASGVALRAGADTPITLFLGFCGDFTLGRNGAPNVGPDGGSVGVQEPAVAGRAFHTATVFTDGEGRERVFVAGGIGGLKAPGSCTGEESNRSCRLTEDALADAFVIDPQTGMVDPGSATTLTSARAFHTATLLEGGKKVLLAGGALRARAYSDARHQVFAPAVETSANEHAPADSVEVVDLSTTPPTTTSLRDASGGARFPDGARMLHSAVAVPGGALLLGGLRYDSGASAVVPLATTVYARVEGTGLEAGPALPAARYAAASADALATPLGALFGGEPGAPDAAVSAVLAVIAADGGATVSPAVATGSPRMGYVHGVAARADDGRVVVTGGLAPIAFREGSTAIAAGETPKRAAVAQFGPDGSAVTLETAGSGVQRAFHAAATLVDGRVLLAGGAKRVTGDLAYNVLKSVEAWEPATNRFTTVGGASTASLREGRAGLTLSAVSNGTAIAFGGLPDMKSEMAVVASGTLEVWNPWPSVVCPSERKQLDCARFFLPPGVEPPPAPEPDAGTGASDAGTTAAAPDGGS